LRSVQAIEQKKKWASLWAAEKEPLFDFTFDLFDERKEAFKKSIARTIKSHQIVKSNPDLMSTHMTGAMGSGPGFVLGSVGQSGSSAASNHYGPCQRRFCATRLITKLCCVIRHLPWRCHGARQRRAEGRVVQEDHQP
jgi:hypothetical protein